MKSDLTTALALARAAIEGALANVEINLESLERRGFVAETRKKSRVIDRLTGRAMHLSCHTTCPFVWPFAR